MKQNGVVCWPGPALLFFIFRFEYLISGPKSYRDFRETGPRALPAWAEHLFPRALLPLSQFISVTYPRQTGGKHFHIFACMAFDAISSKTQCSIFHYTLHNLYYILCLSFEFALAIQLFCIQHSTLIYATFKFSLSTFNFS